MVRKVPLTQEQIELSNKMNKLVLEDKEDSDEYKELEYLFNKISLEQKLSYS